MKTNENFLTNRNAVNAMIAENFKDSNEKFIANLCTDIYVEIELLKDGGADYGTENANKIFIRLMEYLNEHDGNTVRNLVTKKTQETDDWYEDCLRYAIGFALPEGSNDMSYFLEVAGALARSTDYDIWTFNEWQDDMIEKRIEKYVAAIWTQINKIIEVYESYDTIIKKESRENENLSQYDDDYISYEDNVDGWMWYVETASDELSFSANDVLSEIDAVMQAFVDDNKKGLFDDDS
jgi:hypothetical protein